MRRFVKVFGNHLEDETGSPDASRPVEKTKIRLNSLVTIPFMFNRVRWLQVKKWTFRMVEFGLVQGLVQALTAIAGLLIVRTLAKQDYALFAIANSMQATTNLLADLGISIGVRSIGGRVCEDRQRFGQLLMAALTLRRWFALASLGVTIPIAAWMLWRNGASSLLTVGLCLTIIAGVIPLLESSVWITSLQLHGQYRRLQKIDFSNALLRLAMIGGLLHFYLNVVTAALAAVVGNWYQLFWLRRFSTDYADTAQPPHEEDKKELKQISQKMLPNGIFFCLQSQISVWIITVFGNASHVAEVSALGRIAVLFSILNTTMETIVIPRFSRCQEPHRLLRRYFQLLAVCVIISAALVGSAALCSKQFLWLLGPHYSHLKPELLLMLLSTVTSFIAGVMWTINASRAWIKGANLYIPATIITQIVVLLFLNVSTVRGVLIFSFLSVLPSIALNAYMAWAGFKHTFKTLSPVSANS